MRKQTERSPVLEAPGSRDFTGLIANSTAQSIGAEEDEFQALSPNDLCEQYVPLAHKIARSYSGKGIYIDDLESAGYWGLLLASRKFDPARGVPFGGYAQHWIKGEIRALFKRDNNVSSLNAPAFSDDDESKTVELIDCVADEAPPPVTPDLNCLTDKERHVVLARARGETLEAVGRDLARSTERVRQIESKAYKKLRQSGGQVVRGCIRDLLNRRSYRKPLREEPPFKQTDYQYPCRTYSKAEIEAYERGEL